MIVLLLVVGGWLGWVVQRAWLLGAAVAAIRRAGGTVLYDWQWKGRWPNLNAKPWAPEWLVDLVGVDYFGDVIYVALPKPASDADLEYIVSLGRLERLFLEPSNINDRRLDRLTALTRLKALYLDGSRVTDAGLANLVRFSSLEELTLSGTNITDAGMRHVGKVPMLRQLNVTNTQITDAGLDDLKGLTMLKSLCIRSTKIARAASVAELRDALPMLKIDH